MTEMTSKTCWPELVGKSADEAVQVIKTESGFIHLNNEKESILIVAFSFGYSTLFRSIESTCVWARFTVNA